MSDISAAWPVTNETLFYFVHREYTYRTVGSSIVIAAAQCGSKRQPVIP